MSRRWYGYLVIASLVSLVTFLYGSEYLEPVAVRSHTALALSGLFLLVGFLGQATSWWAAVNEAELTASLSLCVAGSGLSVFTRYIPGKVFAVLGRAMHLSEHRGYPLSRVSVVSLTVQVVSLWTGLSVGVAGLMLGGANIAWKGPVAVTWVILTLTIFTDVARSAAEQVAQFILGEELTLPRLRFGRWRESYRGSSALGCRGRSAFICS